MNTLTNGEVLSAHEGVRRRFRSLHVQGAALEHDRGRHVRPPRPLPETRAPLDGVRRVVPSQNESIKAAYYDPEGGGTFSYWEYPTGPFQAPHASFLDANGDVANAARQPLLDVQPEGPEERAEQHVPELVPLASRPGLREHEPSGTASDDYQSSYQGNLSTVGQTRTRSPWGTLDQAGNVVEWTGHDRPVSRRLQGPESLAAGPRGHTPLPAYQLSISAIGPTPEANVAFERIYPSEGFRIGVIGNLGKSKQ